MDPEDCIVLALQAARDEAGHWGTADRVVLAFVERLAELCADNTHGRWENFSATRYLADETKKAIG